MSTKRPRQGLNMTKKLSAIFVSALFAGGATAYYFAPQYIDSGALAPAAASFSRIEEQIQAIAFPTAAPRIEHIETPKAVKAIYMSQCAAGSASLRSSLLALADETEVNSIVVDIKDYSGTIVFPSEIAIEGGDGCYTSSFRELVKEMHSRDIYVIGRVTVFQDPLYTATYPEYAVKKLSDGTTWTDYKGLAFVDVGARPFWDYIIGISKEAHALGVDEINFDYIRYPSDGPMSDVSYTHSSGEHQVNVETFFAYLSQKVRVEEHGHTLVTSADLFGMTTTNVDDLSIGQVLERALPYFDHIAPMVYPSHYPSGFRGYVNPNKHVYGVVNFSMARGVERAKATTTFVAWFGSERVGTSTPAIYTKDAYSADALRPWLQDFNYGGTYGPEEIQGQIQATYDAGISGWMFWDPANRYSSLEQALKNPSTTLEFQ